MTKISALTELTGVTGNEWEVVRDTGAGTTYKVAAGRVGMTLLETGSARTTGSVKNIDVRPYQDYEWLTLRFKAVETDTDNTAFAIQISVDSGANYDTGSKNHEWGLRWIGGGFTGQGGGWDTGEVRFVDNTGNGANYTHDSTLHFTNWRRQDFEKAVVIHTLRTIGGTAGDSVTQYDGAGMFRSYKDITHIQFLVTGGGNCDTGTYYLHGWAR